jgi:hypothetical protein
VVTPSDRFAITIGLCASILVGCGVSDRPLQSLSSAIGGASSTGGSNATGGSSANGGSLASGGSNSNGGSRSTGGSVVTGTGGSPNGGSGSGGTPVGTGGGPDTTPSVTGAAQTTSEGALTNLPGASIVKASGNIVITSLYVTVETLSTTTYVNLWGDIENRGSSVECDPSATVAINGQDVTTGTYGPAYTGTFTLSAVCLPPRGTGAIVGIESDVSATLLSQGSNVSYYFDTSVRAAAVPHPGAPTLQTAAIVASGTSYVVSGNMKAGTVDIYNLSLDFFIRDSSGLLRDQESDYILDSTYANTVVPYQTYSTPALFSRWVEWPSFIEGLATAAVAGPPSENEIRKQLVRQRFADLAAARRRIRR